MHPSTKSQIRHIMSGFGETKHHLCMIGLLRLPQADG